MILFVAKSSPERTRVPRRVTDRLTVRCLVNINPGRPRTSSTAAPRKSQHHRLRSQRSESKSFFFLKQAHGIKRAIKEVGEGGGAATLARRAREGAAAPARWARGSVAAPARGGATVHSCRGDAAPTRGGEAAPAQGGAAARGALACSFSKCGGCLLVSEDAPPVFCESWKGGCSSRGLTTHSSAADDHDGLRLQDQCFGWGAGERSAPPFYDDDGGLDVSGPGSGSDGGAPPAATISA
jgi:hypothetical protein